MNSERKKIYGEALKKAKEPKFWVDHPVWVESSHFPLRTKIIAFTLLPSTEPEGGWAWHYLVAGSEMFHPETIVYSTQEQMTKQWLAEERKNGFKKKYKL